MFIFLINDIMSLQSDYNSLEKVPKIIHRIWFDFNECKGGSNFNKTKTYTNIPEKFKVDYDLCHKIHKDWKVILWNKKSADKFVQKNFDQELWLIYDNIDYPVQKVDMLKYMVLYIYGGVVLDIDISCFKKLDCFYHRNTIYLPQTHPNLLPCPTIDNYMLASCPKHPFWDQVFIEIKKRQDLKVLVCANLLMWMADKELHTILYQTGPGVLHYVYHKYNSVYNTKLLDRELFNPKHVCLGLIYPLTNSYLLHDSARMWMRDDCRIEEIYFLCQEHLLLALFVIAIILFILGILRM